MRDAPFSPELMMQYAALLQKLNPDADSLVAALSKHVDDDMLMSIAIADYGMNVEGHFEALRQIRDEQTVFAPMKWEPKEVLSLTRWSNPGEIYEGQIIPPETVLKEHVIRAFVCAALLRAMADPLNEGYFGGDNETIAPLLESLSVLHSSLQSEALRFFAWHVQSLNEWDNENPFYILALLVLVLRTRADLTHIELKALIDWVYDEVRSAYKEHYFPRATSGQWLQWLTSFNLRHLVWQKIGLEISSLADHYGNSEGRQNLKALARHLETIKP
jgi:hypothetical protein